MFCGKEENIRSNIEVLKKFGISNEYIENCLSAVVKAKPLNLYKMLEILTQNGVENNTIKNALSLLKDSSPTEIYETFRILKENGIESDLINKYYSVKLFKKSTYVKDIFSDKPVYIKQYLKFKKKYNQILSMEEINQICKEKNATIEEFLIQADDKSTFEIVLKTLKQKGNIYIGDYIPMSKEDIDKYADLLLRISKGVAASFMSLSKTKDFQDMQDFVMETLLTRCGNLVYNLDSNIETMHNALFSKCKKYLYLYEKINNMDIMTDFQSKRNQNLGNKRDKEKNEIDLEKWNVNDDDRFVLQMLSQVLEEGYNDIDAFEIGAQRLNMKVEDFLKKIEKIKSNNEHLQENRYGDER